MNTLITTDESYGAYYKDGELVMSDKDFDVETLYRLFEAQGEPVEIYCMENRQYAEIIGDGEPYPDKLADLALNKMQRTV